MAPRRWRKRKLKEGRHKRGLVVDLEYIWRKKVEARRKSQERIIEDRKRANYRSYLKRVLEESDVFDKYWGIRSYKGGNDCPLAVRLYAKLGLHRYNILQGTNLQLHGIEKYNREKNRVWLDSYYITLVAEDPATSSLVTFQTSVTIHRKKEGEGGCKVMDVVCHIARPKDTATNGRSQPAKMFDHDIKVPDWPLFVDKNHEMQESEWEENDWIRLYLELAFCTTMNPQIHDKKCLLQPNLPDFKILNVVKETEPPNFRNAIVYITYDQDSGVDGVASAELS